MDLLLKVLYVSMSRICTCNLTLDTWTVFPWGDENGSVAGLICDVYTTEGEPFAGDPRGNLETCSLSHGRKWDSNPFNLGPEPEFFLFKLDEKWTQHLKWMTRVATLIWRLLTLRTIHVEIVNAWTKMGFEVEASHHQVSGWTTRDWLQVRWSPPCLW